jgi:hypothetical protein
MAFKVVAAVAAVMTEEAATATKEMFVAESLRINSVLFMSE